MATHSQLACSSEAAAEDARFEILNRRLRMTAFRLAGQVSQLEARIKQLEDDASRQRREKHRPDVVAFSRAVGNALAAGG